MIDRSPTLRSILDVSAEEATERIAEAVDESVWDTVGIPRRLRHRAAGKIAATLDAFLSTSVLALVSGALKSYPELARYADGKDHEVTKLDITIESEHEPHVELKVNRLASHVVRFPLVVSLQFSGATLVIRRDHVMAMKTGRCVVSGLLYCEELEVFNRPASRFKIRNVIEFGEGIPIVGTPS